MGETATVGVPEVSAEARTPVASVYSVYMENIDPLVCEYQAKVMKKFLPVDWVFEQVKTAYRRYAHADQMSALIQKSISDVVVLLDIDCVPLKESALPYLLDHAALPQGELVGCAQRANHIPNGAHIYAGPFCMAFSRHMYAALGSPTLREAMLEGPYRPVAGQRGDVAEELTYIWEQYKHPVTLIRPTHVENPLWGLEKPRQFGHGTTYGDMFYHAFESRLSTDRQSRFISKCKEILGESGDVPSLKVKPIITSAVPAPVRAKYGKDGCTQNWWDRNRASKT